MTAYDTFKAGILGNPYDANKKPSRALTVQGFKELQDQVNAVETSGALGYPNFNTTALGIAGTSNGESFTVLETDYLVIYENVSGTATERGKVPLDGVLSAEATARAAADAAEATARAAADAAEATERVDADLQIKNQINERDVFENNFIPLFYDRNGRVVLSVDYYGDMVFENWNVPENKGRDVSSVIWSFQDLSGAASFGVAYNGDFVISNNLQMETINVSRENETLMVWTVGDLEGKYPIGVDWKGEFHFRPAPEASNLISNAQYKSPSFFSKDYPTYNVRDLGDQIIATRQDQDGRSYDVLKNVNGSTALMQHFRPLRFHPVMGQSNAGQGGSTGVLFTGEYYQTNVMTYSHSNSAYGTSTVDQSNFTDIKPVSDFNKTGQFPATLSSFALEYSTRMVQGETTPGILTFTCWEGGQPLSRFIRGTENWDNLMTSAFKSKEVAEKYNRAVNCQTLTFIQGESGPEATYETDLIAFADDVRTELSTQMGLQYEPELVILQINTSDTASSESTVYQSQLNAAKNTNGITLAGPMYNAPLGDTIHQSPIGRMIISETLAECLREIEQTTVYDNNGSILTMGSFEPLQPINVSLNGSSITIVYNKNIEIDDDWVLTVENFGFVYSDDASSATITSVSKTDVNEITIQLSNAPAGANRLVEYATYNATTTQDGWANGRGLVYSPTKTPSLYHKLGFDVPAFTRHYCARFKETI